MKDFKKFLKELNKDERFEIKETNSNTLKIVYIKTGELYSVHPADQAIRPIKGWIKRVTDESGN